MQKTTEMFDKRNDEKKQIEFSFSPKIVKQGEFRICKIGVNVGAEISKDGKFKRPILVLKTGVGGDMIVAIPITTKVNQYFEKFYYEIKDFNTYGLREKSFGSLNQIKVMSIKRLLRKLNNIKIGGVRIPTYPMEYLKEISELGKEILFN